MLKFTQSTQATASRATTKVKSKTKRFAARVRRMAAKAARVTRRKGTKAAHATARGAGKAAGLFVRGTKTAVSAVARAAWWLITLVWTVVSTVVALIAYGIAWIFSAVSAASFAAGVGFTMAGMILTGTMPEPAEPTVQTDPKDRPSPDHLDPDSFVRDDEYQEPPMTIADIERSNATVYRVHFDDAIAKNDVEKKSYYFGKLQAAEAIAAGLTSGRGWAMVSKELKLPTNEMIRKDVKRGWDEEFNDAAQHAVSL